jgi:PKD domain/Glycosyl hydrolase family 26
MRASRLLCAFVLLLIPVAAVPLLPDPASAASTNSVLFGTFLPTTASANHAQTYSAFESTLGRAVSIDRVYSAWDDAQPVAALTDDQAHGRLPLLSIRPQLRNGTKLAWSAIAGGAYDADIARQANGLAGFGSPVVLAFHHEADVANGYGGASDFVAAYRHYVTVFRAAGASNVRFAVIFVPITFASAAIDAWYPGDAYVDWIGTDAYNWNGCVTTGAGWRSLAQVAGAFESWGSARNKPLVLAEWGSVDDPNDPARRASWIDDALTTMGQWSALRAAVYFDSSGSCDWRLPAGSASLSAYVTAARTAIANGAASAVLLDPPPTAPAPLTATLNAGGSTGTGYPTGQGIESYAFDPGDGTAVAQQSGQPGALTHVYRTPGRYTARLTVVDVTGATATTTAVIHAAGPPVVSEGTPTLSATTATLPAWIQPDGLAATYRFEWGFTSALGSRTVAGNLPAVDRSVAVTGQLSGLTPNTRYYWRAVATTQAGTTYGPTRFFATPS